MNKETISYDYLDVLRLLACFAVILLHYSGSYTYRFGIDTFDIGIFYFTLTRWCVPIFLMISGALLLNKNYDITVFYKKRFLRILPPFIFWSFIYIAYKLTMNKAELSDVFNLFLVKGAEFHFWYVFLILGIILFLPFITDWTEKKSKKSIVIFLIIWLFWILSVKQYNVFYTGIDLIYFSKYLGYLILGYYLHIITHKKYYWLIGLILFIIGFYYSYYSTIQISYENKKKVELLQPYLSWNVLFMAVGVFLIIKRIRLPLYILKLIKEISKYTFGIYLAHIIIRDVFVSNYFNFFKFDNYSFIIIKTSLVLFLSYLIVKLLNKIPIIGKYISG